MSRRAVLLGRIIAAVTKTAAAAAATRTATVALGSPHSCTLACWFHHLPTAHLRPCAALSPLARRSTSENHRHISAEARKLFSYGRPRQDDRSRLLKEDKIEEAARTCWRCGGNSPPEKALCPDPKCKAALPLVKGLSYFDMLLGPGKIAFDIDLNKLRRNFLSIQQGVHPDSHLQKSEKEHAFAEQQSVFANKGYRTLKDPVLRGMYMLELYGKPISEDVSLAENDFELLAEVMDYREQIEEAEGLAALKPIREDMQGKFDQTLSAASDAFRANDLDEARRQIVRLRYYQNIERAAEDKAFRLSG